VLAAASLVGGFDPDFETAWDAEDPFPEAGGLWSVILGWVVEKEDGEFVLDFCLLDVAASKPSLDEDAGVLERRSELLTFCCNFVTMARWEIKDAVVLCVDQNGAEARPRQQR